jgi:hypothetical protein
MLSLRKIKTVSWLSFAFVIAFSTISVGQMSSNIYKIPNDLIDTGGGSESSAHYRIKDCIGQPLPIGTSQSPGFNIAAGYVYVAFVYQGDANGDGVINIADVIYLVNYLFTGGPVPCPQELGDANCDGVVDIADVVYLINYLFAGGPPPCEGKGMSPTHEAIELSKGKALAQVELSSQSISKDGIFNVPIIGKFVVDLAAVQLEIKYDPEKVTLLEPALTKRTQGLTIYSSSKEGIHKTGSLRSLQVGILDLKGEHHISAGNGALVTLRMRGSDLSCLEITEAILVDRDAQKIPVEIISEINTSEEALIAGKPAVPQEFSLSQNYPNPFNPETEISYDLPKESHVKLSVYNIKGQRVKILVDKIQAAGHKTVTWDGTNEQGDRVASGVFFYRLEAGEFTATKKMVLLR